MKLIFSMIKKHLLLFCCAIFFLTIEALCDLLQPAFMSRIVDEGVKYQDTSVVLYYGMVMLGVALLGALGAVMRNILASRTSQQIGKELRSVLFQKIQTFSYANIDKLNPASLITRLTNDVTQIQNFINGSMRILVKAPITCIGAIFLIVTRTPKQIPMIILILILCSIWILGNMLLGYPRFARLQKKLDRLNNVSREFLTSIRVVKAFGRERFETDKFANAADELAASGTSAMRVTSVFGPLINLTVNTGIVVLLWLGGNGEQTDVGKLMASVNYMTQVLFSLSMVSNILNSMVRATASAKRVQQVLDEVPAMSEPKNPKEFNLTGEVQFENVSFSYPGSKRMALQNISFSAISGSAIGIIGSTGSGKSTLVNMIPRFYDVSAGAVFVGGQDVCTVETRHLRSHIGIVPQKSFLFSGSIIDNLRWGDSKAADDSIYKAAKAACAHSFIESFPDGYDTILGQGGVNLSGGQKQRLSIARALIRQPGILILDDCTSALDASTEAAVMHNIRSHSQGTTVFLISQRISSVMRSDLILCMEDGVLCGQGNHEELLNKCTVYQEIYRSQIGDDEIARA
ncbi:ABC transporter ATP-binding protein [Robinsoniella peoriensis]|uniref:Putative ABC transporter ATP-binding protein n=1 Tax=Robinsoniella peoriensis TaxID=180332 RepID=A0A4U8QJH4_9FIRM|nr:ABC transporter ATP-binding protein [Robinsoniella peoriensis]MDU7028091.1 ABC transporter ATP-binding protein [Clostridiales bacterium]TLD01386.1 putative ABC transporter ATP-binding protein [Robinsoniella peoriensis]